MAAPKNTSTSISTISTTQPISMVNTMGLMQTSQQHMHHNISLLQKQQQIAAFQNQQRASPQQLVTSVRPVATLQNLQNLHLLGKCSILCYFRF